MKIKMLAYCAGPDGAYNLGQVVDVSADEGTTLINGGYAVAVEAAAPAAVEPAPVVAEKAAPAVEAKAAPAVENKAAAAPAEKPAPKKKARK